MEHKRYTLEISGRWELFTSRTWCIISPYIKRVTRRAVFSVTPCLPREDLLQCDDCQRRWFDSRQNGVKVFSNARRVTLSHFPLNWLHTWPSCLISTSLRHRELITFNESKMILTFYHTWTLSTHSVVSYNNKYYIKEWVHAVVQLVEALRYKWEGRGFDFRWCHCKFSLT